MKEETIVHPKLESDRLVLRTITVDDLDFIYRHFADGDVNKYLVDEEPVSSRDAAMDIVTWASNLKEASYHRWLIQIREDSEPVGTCGFHNWDKKNNRTEIGYDLSKAFWQKGITSEAVTLLIQYVITTMNVNRIEAFVHLDNIGSCNLLKKLSFQLEGIIRDKHLFRGRYYDHYCFSLLKRDWK